MEFSKEEYAQEALVRILSRFGVDKGLMGILVTREYKEIESLLQGVVQYSFQGFHDNYTVDLKEVHNLLKQENNRRLKAQW